MNCREIERRFQEVLDASAPADVLADAARHLASCASCRDLEEILRAVSSRAGVAGPDLTGDVMALTSGPACGAAMDHLADLADGALDAAQRDLVMSHLSGCAACEELASTIVWMSHELPSLAVIDPGESFTTAVLRATIRTNETRTARRPRASLQEWWSALLVRPRITWEVAYAGALVIWLLCGTAFSPFRDVPSRALDLARVNSVQVLKDTVQPASFGRQVWQATGGRVLQEAETSVDGLSLPARRLGEASGSFANHGAEMIGSVFRGDLSGSAMRLRDMGADLGTIWNELWRRDKDRNDKEAPKAKAQEV